MPSGRHQGLSARVCDGCGRTYQPAQSRQRFCTLACRKAWHQRAAVVRALRALADDLERGRL